MPIALLGLLAILLVSALCGWWMATRKTSETPVRVMIFVGYFWLLAFVQIILAVLGYLGWQHFYPH